MLAAERSTVDVPIAAPPPDAVMGWTRIMELVEPFLLGVGKRLAAQTDEFDSQISGYARYALTVQGKQLRPILVWLSGATLGKVNESHLTAAVIIEMVHLATLVHDDVIDRADLRRGRPSVAANWGNELSVLLGDCLFAQSLKLAASFPTPEICRAVSAATSTVCAGEILQTRTRGDFNVSREHYFKVLGMKTAELFSLSCSLGGLLSQASSGARDALRGYGMALGTAYQLYDDCLDVLGSEVVAGKTLGVDLAEGKLTLPVLIVRDRASAADLEQLQKWMCHWEPAFLPGVVELVERYDAFAESRQIIQEYLDSARQALTILPVCEGRAGLAGLTKFLSEQTDALGVNY